MKTAITPPTPARDIYWDIWKGIAIIAVILIHTAAGWCGSTKSGLVFRQFIDFPVFLFFAVAGYFSGEVKSGEALDFIKRKIRRLLPPFLLASVLYAIAKSLLDRNFSIVAIMKRLPEFSCGFGYFVIALLSLFLIAPLFQKIASIGMRLVSSAILSLLSIASIYLLLEQGCCREMVPIPLPAIFFTTWIFAFTLGAALRERTIENIGKAGIFWLVCGLVAASLLAIGEAFFCERCGVMRISLSQLKISSFLQSSLLFMLLCALNRRKSACKYGEILAFLGRNSYFIYLYHWFYIAFYRKISAGFSIGKVDFILPVAVVFSCAITAWLLRKFGSRRVAYWFGYSEI